MYLKKYFSIIFILLSYVQLNAQASFEGFIEDKSTNEKIIGAVISIPDLHSIQRTDTSGHFIFSNIPEAQYQIEIKAIGYKIYTTSIDISELTKYNFNLDKSSTELSEVVVTGSSKATDIKKSPLPILSINTEFLNSNLSTNIIDAMAKIPGLNTVSTGPNVSKPYIRGLGFNRILTLFDGVRQEGQQWGDEHGIEIDNYMINKIEVIKGPASLMYGSDALAGAINLIPDLPSHDQKINGNIISEYQTNNGMIGFSAILNQRKNGVEWGARFSQKFAKDFQNAIDGRVYNTGFRYNAANAFVGIHKSCGFSHLNFSMYNNLQEIPDGSRDSLSRKFTMQTTEDDTFRPIVQQSVLNSYNISVIHQQVNHYRLFWKNSFFLGNKRLDANLAFQKSKRQEFSHPEVPYQNIPGLSLQLNTFNYDFKYFFQEIKKWSLVTGINGMYQTNIVDKGTEFLIPPYHQFDFGAFFTFNKNFKKLNVSGGLRYDFRNINTTQVYADINPNSGFDMVVYNSDTVGADLLFKNFKTQFNGFTGSLGLSYILNRIWSFKFNLARGYRAPNISEISSNGVHPGTGFYQIGNDNFKPEFSNQIDMGAAYNSKTLNASLSIFANKISNYIYNSRLMSVYGGDSMRNSGSIDYPTYKFLQGSVLMLGYEGNLDFHIIKPLHFENSLSMIYGDNRSFTGTARDASNEYVPFMPPFRLLSELRFEFNDTKIFNNSFVKFQLQHTATQNRVYTYDNTESATNGYTLFNLGVGTDIKNKKDKTIFNLNLICNNLFNTSYQDHLSRLKYFEQYSASPNGSLGIYNMGRNIGLKLNVFF